MAQILTKVGDGGAMRVEVGMRERVHHRELKALVAVSQAYFEFSCLQVTLLLCIFFDAGIGGGAPPEGASSANTKLPAAVDFFDRVCAYALTTLKRSSSALANVYQGVFPGQSAPTDAEALATPFYRP